MQTWDLPADIDLRTLTVSEEQFRTALGLTRYRYSQLDSGVVVKNTAQEETLTINPALDLDMMTVTQKQFADAIGLSPARVNQLVKSGVLVTAPASKRLMFLASMESYYSNK